MTTSDPKPMPMQDPKPGPIQDPKPMPMPAPAPTPAQPTKPTPPPAPHAPKGRLFATACAMVLLITLTGCSATEQAATAAGTAAATAVVSHIASVNVAYNTTTGEITGGLVFKNGRWVREVEDPNAGVFSRAVDPCAPAPVREVTRAEVYELRTAVQAFTRPVQIRQVVAHPKVEVKTQKLRETTVPVYDQCGKKSRAVVGVQPASLWYRFTHPCATYDDVPTVATATIPAETTTYVQQTQTTPSVPDIGLPPSGIMKSTTDTEARLKSLEDRCKQTDTKLDSILAILSKK